MKQKSKPEPTEDWKVEHVLQWWLLRANAESEAEYNTIVENLGKQLEEGKKEIWEAHEQVSEIVKKSENIENQSNNIIVNNNNSSNSKTEASKRQSIEKPAPKPKAKPVTAASTRPTRSKKPTAVAAAAANASAASAPKPETKKLDTIHIEIVKGPYAGTFYDLQPKTRSPSWLGRSSSAKFKDRGISLPQDLEVSTSHGKFEFKQGTFYFTDVASTNGTRINNEDCEPNQPYELKAKGMTILAGQTTMKITLLTLG